MPRIAALVDNSDRRQWPRYAIDSVSAFVLTADGNKNGCVMEDVSLGGARLRLLGDCPRNFEVRIEHPDIGHVYAVRKWIGKRRLAVEFGHEAGSAEFVASCLELAETRNPINMTRRAIL